MQGKKKMLVIDGNSILNRAFYGVKPLTTRDGRPTGAIFGFVNIIMKACDSIKPDALGIAFDLHAPTFRHKEYAEYKAGRHATPPDLLLQFEPSKEIASALGFHILSLEGYEADDILGTCAKNADDGDYECYILTGDRDSLQLISDNTFVLLAKNNETQLYTKEVFAQNYAGLAPEKLIELKALMGDSSDNIPGVPGIGEKTALKLICEYGSIDNLYSEGTIESSDMSPKMKEKLLLGKESAYLSRFLGKIFCQVPIPLSFSELEKKERDTQKLYELFTDLELSVFIDRFCKDTRPEKAEKFEDYEKIENLSQAEISSEPLFVYPDFEGSSIFLDCGKKYLLPKTSDNLKSVFDGKYKTVLYDSKAVAYELLKLGAELNGCVFDIRLAAYLCDPSAKNEPADLSGLAKKEVSAESDEISNGFSLLLSMPYLYEYFSQLLKTNKSEKLYYETEMPLAIVLSKMEIEGMALDKDGLAAYNKVLSERIEQRKENIYALAGQSFNINSPKQLGQVLFEALGLPVMKKTKSGYSTDAETLEHLRAFHPIINEILDFRAVTKLKSTYGDGLLESLGQDGRLHTSFKHAFTQTGRLSSAEPNLQNIPIKTAEGREIRKYFVAKNSDYCLIDADYSQIELRILAALSGDETMINAFRNGDDIHAITASQVFGVPLSQVTPEMRKSAKAVNFGIVYGISDFSLAGDIGVTKKEAASYIEGYFAKYPKVKAFLDALCENASRDGYVSTHFGRRRYIPELANTKKTVQALGRRYAMNTPIQGTAADIIKIAMVNTDKALTESGLDARLILQVHDELIVECKKSDAQEAGEILRREMENAASVGVPLSVDLHIADSWYDAH